MALRPAHLRCPEPQWFKAARHSAVVNKEPRATGT